MKSKNWRPIVLKNPKLRQIRTNLRIVLNLAVEEKSDKLFRLTQIYYEKCRTQGLTRSQQRRYEQIRKTRNRLDPAYGKSILRCNWPDDCATSNPDEKPKVKIDMDAEVVRLQSIIDGTITRKNLLSSIYIKILEQDMVWNPIDRDYQYWMCINCYNKFLGNPADKKDFERFVKKHERMEDRVFKEYGLELSHGSEVESAKKLSIEDLMKAAGLTKEEVQKMVVEKINKFGCSHSEKSFSFFHRRA